MLRFTPLFAALFLLAACNRGPDMYDERYKPGQYNVTEIEFLAVDPAQKDFVTAQQILPTLLAETLPELPGLPEVILEVTVDKAGRQERSYSSYYKDPLTGKESGSKDEEITVTYEVGARFVLVEKATGNAIGDAYVDHSVETDSYTKSSSFTESLLSQIISGKERVVDMPTFYREYNQKILERLYPPK
jgi:hypothetical protein